jgi:hypothetical protein
MVSAISFMTKLQLRISFRFTAVKIEIKKKKLQQEEEEDEKEEEENVTKKKNFLSEEQ